MRLADKLTATHIKEYAAFMRDRFDLLYVTDADKELKDDLRKAVIRINPLVDIDSYFARWAFTLGKFIWTPFSVQNPAELPLWPYYWQVITLAHETRHRLQCKKYDFEPYAWEYLSNEESRGQFEYEALLTALELSPVLLDGESQDPVNLARILAHYGCSEATQGFVANQLTAAKRIITAGGIISEPSQATIDWLAENVR